MSAKRRIFIRYGSSCSGKTNLLNLMSTIDKATAGEIYFEGRNLAMLNNGDLARLRRHKIGFVFQDFNLLDNMTIMDNIALPLALNRANHKIIMAAVEGVFSIKRTLLS